MNSKDTTYLFDSNIIIDFYEIDKTLFKKLNKLGSLVIQDVVVAEINIIKENKIRELGIQIKETSTESLINASDIAENSGLSFADAVCLIESDKNNFYCVTNDKALYNRCKKNNINVLWGLELILLAVKEKIITSDQSVTMAKKLKEINFKITTEIIESFLKELEELK